MFALILTAAEALEVEILRRALYFAIVRDAVVGGIVFIKTLTNGHCDGGGWPVDRVAAKLRNIAAHGVSRGYNAAAPIEFRRDDR